MEFTNVSEALRNVLKSRSITYKDLADKLKMSESGVKKLLTGDDISFNKLNAILSFLDISLKDLISLKSRGFAKLTDKQENFLLKHPQHFNFFVQLHHHLMSLELVKADNHKLSKAKMNQYVDDLVKIEVLEFVDGKLTSSLKDGFTMSDKLTESFQKRSYGAVIDSLKNADEYKKTPWLYEGFGQFALTHKSALEFRMALEDLLKEFSKRTDREKKIHKSSDLVHCAALLVNADLKVKDIFPI
ncbi:helix-turn-helix domain-containing protein [Bdellovibrio sp. GT3]|uniref:helix-turn-helix domain-containing protein n=1 Tax=Bdellovibrio sp. GT3 TaxID=3136282 RepID=UPI0030F201E7